jgi:predicted transcriptional regulator
MELAEKLELHYYFTDTSHSMDANVRNRCEQEVLAIIQDTANTLGIAIKIDAEAYTEGGLKEVWKVLGANNAQIALIVSVVALILSQVPNIDPENDELQKELTELSTEEKKLNIEKLKKELETPIG